jgi:hypothetical protein
MDKIEFEIRYDDFGDEIYYFQDGDFNIEIWQIELDDDDDCCGLIIDICGEIIVDENGTFDEMKSLAQDEYEQYKSENYIKFRAINDNF